MIDGFIRTSSYLYEIEKKTNEQRQISELQEILNKQKETEESIGIKPRKIHKRRLLLRISKRKI